MAVNNFIPTVWAGMLLKNLNNDQVYTDATVINRDYEGEIKSAGDTVRIGSIGRITISDMTKNTDINSPEAVNDSAQVLRINQQKYFNFQVDDVDKAQQNLKVMNEAMQEASWGLRDTMDQFVGGLWTDIPAANTYGTDGSPRSLANTAGNTVYEALVKLGIYLDNTNTPKDGRFAILSPWMYGQLLLDSRFVGYGTQANFEVLQNGKVGRAAGFDIRVSNNVSNASAAKYKLIAGHKIAWSFAMQIMKIEAFRPEKRFADAMKGLCVYGGKVTRPNNLALCIANDGS